MCKAWRVPCLWEKHLRQSFTLHCVICVVIEATSYFSSFVAGHSYVSSKAYSCEPQCQTAFDLRQTSNSSFFFCQSSKLFHSEAEDESLLKPGLKPFENYLLRTDVCYGNGEEKKKERDEKENCSSSLMSVKKTQSEMWRQLGCLKSHFRFSGSLTWGILGCRKEGLSFTTHCSACRMLALCGIWLMTGTTKENTHICISILNCDVFGGSQRDKM